MTGKADTPRLETPTAQMGQTPHLHFLVQGLHGVAELGIAESAGPTAEDRRRTGSAYRTWSGKGFTQISRMSPTAAR